MARKETKKAQFGILTAELASASLDGVSMLKHLPNPDPILREKGGRMQVYRDLKDAHLGSVQNKRRMAVSSKPWSLQSGEGNYEQARLVETRLWNMGARNSIRQIMSAIDFGYQVTEVIWECEDGIWLPAALKDRAQEMFKFSKSGELVFASEKNGEIPQRKFLLTQYNASSLNPYGVATLSECFWPLACKKSGTKFWMIFAEKFGIPKVVGKHPVGASEQEQENLLRLLHGLIRDAACTISDNSSVDLLEAKFSGTMPYNEIIRWADREISKAYLGETLTTEQTDTGGTRALGEVHNEVRLEMTQDDCAMVEGTMNTLIKWIWELNWPDDDEIPWFQFAQPKDMQSGELDRDKRLHDLGVRFTEKHFIDLYGISPDHIAEIATAQQGGGMNFAEGEPKPMPKPKAKSKKADVAVKEIMKEVSQEDLQEQVEEMAKPIIELCEHCGSYEEFETALLDFAPNIKSDKLERAIEKCMMIAEAKGAMDA